jgi:hypothetical protein
MSVAATQSVAEQPSGYARFLSQLLSDRERLFAEIESSDGLGAKLAYAGGTLTALTALYGASAGAYAGPLQAISAAIKLPLLFWARSRSASRVLHRAGTGGLAA